MDKPKTEYYHSVEELKEWAEETYNFYLPLASKLNMDFYTQSKLTDITDDKPVELMVIGLILVMVVRFLKIDSRKVKIYF